MDLWAGIGKFLFLPSQQKLHFPKVFGFLLLALRLAHLKKNGEEVIPIVSL